ncbi:MAG: TolC family protein [Planctomycetia bacterium]|nr:TolC family protein [Planctomycetia bacterium]
MNFGVRSTLLMTILSGSLACGLLRAQVPMVAPIAPAGSAILPISPPTQIVDGRAPPAQALTPWWNEDVKRPLDGTRTPLSIDLEASVLGVLSFSPQVRIASDSPIIRETQVADAMSRFDPRTFVDSKFTDTSDPVGNLLTTGGASRFIDQTAYSSAGIKKTNTIGGQFEAAQKFGYQNNNSRFFVPPNQGTARMTLTYTQPLLNGSGKVYNTSVICLAELNTQEAGAQFIQDLQAILMETHKAYWDLRLQRATLLQRIKLKQSAIDIQRELQGRADFDVSKSQIVRADAAVATRDAAVIRYATEVANAETKLRALINDPRLNAQPTELLPSKSPYHEPAEPNLVEALTVALQQRPEVKQGFTEVRAAGVKADVSKNELLPVLNLLLGSYVYGLQGNSEIGDAWVSQYAQGRPTYWTGLQFEYPLYNRSANARMTQRLVELRQSTNKLQQTMIQVRAETEVAVREVTTTYREMVSKYQAMQADQTEIEYLTSRWRLAADDQQLAGVVLNDLLGAQERLAAAEYGFAAAEAAYNVALANLNAVTGSLLQADRVRISTVIVDGVPQTEVSTLQPLMELPPDHAPSSPEFSPPPLAPLPVNPSMTVPISAMPPTPGSIQSAQRSLRHDQTATGGPTLGPALMMQPLPSPAVTSAIAPASSYGGSARLLPPVASGITPLPPVAERDSETQQR